MKTDFRSKVTIVTLILIMCDIVVLLLYLLTNMISLYLLGSLIVILVLSVFIVTKNINK